MEPLVRKFDNRLPTRELSALVSGWRHGVVKCNPIDVARTNPEWIVSLTSFTENDLNRLHYIFSIWVRVKFGWRNGKPVNQEAIENFLEKTSPADLRAGIGECGWRQSALPMLCVNSLMGHNLAFAGKDSGALYSCGGNELIGKVHKPENWSLGIRFFMPELGGEQLLACQFRTRRWVTSCNRERLGAHPLRENINAHVCVREGKHAIIPIKAAKEWDGMHLECFRRKYPATPLPKAVEVLENPKGWIEGQPGILLPFTERMYNFKSGDVGVGISMRERTELTEQVGGILSGLVEDGMPVAEHVSRRKFHFVNLLDGNSGQKQFADHVAGCSGSFNIEIWSRSQDDMLRDMLVERIHGIFGSGSPFPLVFRDTGTLADPIQGNHKIRVREMIRTTGQAERPTVSLFIIPPREAYSRKQDPKNAIRKTFALTGRLTQFVASLTDNDRKELGSDKKSVAKKARTRLDESIKNAVWDVLRQSGTVSMPLEKGKGYDCVGVRLMRAGRKYFPVLVKYEPETSKVSVSCNMLDTPDWQPYRTACLEMARVECRNGEGGFSGPDLCRIVNGLRAEYPSPDKPVILTLECDNARRLLEKEPTGMENSGIRHILVNRNTPDYLTPKSTGKKGDERHARMCGPYSFGTDMIVVEDVGKAGMYYDRSFTSLTRAGNTGECLVHPHPVAYRTGHLKPGDDRLELINFLNDTRKFALQYMDCPLEVPLVLHLARGLEEYIIDLDVENGE